MNKTSFLDTPRETNTAIKSAQICMHVLTVARTDVRVMREATALAESGLTVSIVDIEAGDERPSEENVRGVWLKHIRMPRAFLSTRFTKWALVRAAQMLMRSTIRLIRTPADIYHAHDEATLPACCIAALLRRKPLIFDAHELPLTETSMRWRWLRMLFTGFLIIALPRCAGVITVSQPIAQEMQRRYRIPKVLVLRNVPSYQKITRSDQLRQTLGLGPEVRVALYQGSLQFRRGLDQLIRAASFLQKNIVIALLGPATSDSMAEIEALIASEGVADRIKLLPPVPYEALLGWTASADVGLIIYPPDISLNTQMCLPNKFFEYLLVGLPVLSSQLDAVGEVIKTNDVGNIVSSLAPEDVGEAINAMLADQAALARMRYNALEATQREFCWEKEKAQLLDLYQDIVGKREQPAAGILNRTGSQLSD